MESRTATEEVRGRNEDRKDPMNKKDVFLEGRDSSDRYERKKGSQRWHLQVLHTHSSQSRVALFVNLSSIHPYAFCNVPWK